MLPVRAQALTLAVHPDVCGPTVPPIAGPSPLQESINTFVHVLLCLSSQLTLLSGSDRKHDAGGDACKSGSQAQRFKLAWLETDAPRIVCCAGW